MVSVSLTSRCLPADHHYVAASWFILCFWLAEAPGTAHPLLSWLPVYWTNWHLSLRPSHDVNYHHVSPYPTTTWISPSTLWDDARGHHSYPLPATCCITVNYCWVASTLFVTPLFHEYVGLVNHLINLSTLVEEAPKAVLQLVTGTVSISI